MKTQSDKERKGLSKPLFVVISDVHFSINNIELASKAFTAAIDTAAKLKIPLIDCGDITNDKAILRGEYVNILINIMAYAKTKDVKVILLVGNHSLVNEKSKEHVLHFLKPYATIIDDVAEFQGYAFIPYQSMNTDFENAIKQITPGKLLFTHQGFRGAFMGDYIQDKSSISTEIVKNHIVISGHYHRHQTLGPVTYIGSPYTITYGEANDGDKGYLIVNEDGSFERVILKLRKHIILDRTLDTYLDPVPSYAPGDLVRMKLRGSRLSLNSIDKELIGKTLFGHSNFKLDLIVDSDEDTHTVRQLDLTDHELMLKLIDESDATLEETYLEVLNETGKDSSR